MPSPAGPSKDPQEQEQEYRALELAHFRRGRPPHSVRYSDWVAAEARYASLRSEYLALLEYWPGFEDKREMLEKMLEATSDFSKQVRPAARAYEAHLARVKTGDADPSTCQLCCAGVLGSKHPKYQHLPELVREAAAAEGSDVVVKVEASEEEELEAGPGGDRKRAKLEPQEA